MSPASSRRTIARIVPGARQTGRLPQRHDRGLVIRRKPPNLKTRLVRSNRHPVWFYQARWLPQTDPTPPPFPGGAG